MNHSSFRLKLPPLLIVVGGLVAAAAQAQTLQISTVAGVPGDAGNESGPAASALFNGPHGTAVDPAGNVYVADANNNEIRKFTPAGAVSIYAGSQGSGSTDGPAAGALFLAPRGVAVDAAGNVYVADTGNSTVRLITPSGTVSTLAGSAGQFGFADGIGAAARLNAPLGVAVDSTGNLYVADTNNFAIRKITPAGVVTTLAGEAGVSGYVYGPAAAARFNYPSGVAVDSVGNLYVADTFNQVIRKITPAGTVSTLAGAAGALTSVDGTGTNASFLLPTGVAVDSLGNVYVADATGATIRLVTPSGVVTTLAGTPGIPGYVDGAGAAARFADPTGVAVDAKGDVYVADYGNDVIRFGVAAGVPAIGTPPSNQTVGVGSTATFAVQVSSAAGVTYQWSFNGVPITGATSATYTTGPVQLSDQGFYSVAVTNSFGTVIAGGNLTASFVHGSTYTFSSWTAAAPLPAGTAYVAAAYDGSNILTVGMDGTAFFSPDGVNWQASASNGPPGQTWGELNSVANVPGQNMLVAAGNGGAIVTFASGTYAGTLQESGSTALLTGIAEGNGTLVAVGYGGACITSNLAATSWKASSTGTSQNINAVAYGNGRFVGVGLGGLVLTSPDGTTWTIQKLGATTNLYGVAYGARGFVAVGDSGGIYTSPDGALWRTETPPTTNVLVHVAYGDGTFVALGFLGTVLTSVDEGVTWVTQNSGTQARLDGVALGDGTFVLTGQGGVVVCSGTAEQARLINLSARATVGTGGNILIAGFVVKGTGEKQVLLRGIGPTLGQFGVSGALATSTLILDAANGQMLAENSVWGGGAALANLFAQVGAFALPTNSADSALEEALGAGGFTAQLEGEGQTTGVGLAEIYDADAGTPTAQLVNLSARANVGTGSNILIAGFVISGDTPQTVLIRGVGPTLSQFGVTGSLAAPQLVLYDSNNSTLQSNTGWAGAATLAQAFASVGAFAFTAGSADDAMLVTLPPGAYTAEVSGVNSTTGVALAEIYAVP